MKRVMGKTSLLALAFGLLLNTAPLTAQQTVTVAHPTPATPLSGRVDLRPQMKILEEWRQAEYQRLRASGRATAADFKAVDDKFLSRARKAEGYRSDALNQLNKHSGVDIKQGAGGTQPQQGRGLAGDIDTDSLRARDFDKVKKTAERMGYKVTHQGDSMTIEELNVTVHRESAAEAKMGSRTGSSARGAEVRRGLNEETALGFKANNPNASVADNLKKAAHTLDTPPHKMSSEDVQKLGKMIGRNLEELGKLDPTSAKKYETLQRQSDMLKKGYSPEAAGIEDLGKFQKEAREATVKAVKTTEKWAETRTADLTRQAQRAEEALAKARSSGDPVSINQARQQLERTKTDLIGFKETQAAAKEAAVLNANNGKSTTSVLAEAKGLNTSGKSPSMVREQILSPDRNMISRTVNEPLAGGKATAGKAAAGEAAGGMGSKLVKGGMAIMVIYGIVTGVKQGAEQAGEEADKKGDSTMVSILKTAGYSVWHGLGFGAAAETGKKAGEDSASQWAEDVKAGRVDPNSKLSRAWAQMRAVGWGLAEFTGLQAIKDAAVEGGGYVKDRYSQYKNEKQEAQQKKEVADKKAEKEGKDGKDGKDGQKDKVDKEKADKDRAEKEKTDKEKADREKAEKEKVEKEKAEKERAEKEKAEKAEKERLEKAEKEKAEKEAHERRERAREKAEKERQEAERQARERAERQERERLEREKAEAAKKAAAAKAVQQQKPASSGTREEVSGWAKTAKGSTKLTYIKDAAGNVLGGYYTHYDAQGREIGKEHFKNTPETGSSQPASLESFNGSYSGRVSGGASGALNFTVRNGVLSGRISGNYKGDGAFATLSGTVDAAGNVRISAPGYVRGALGEKGKMENWEFEGVMNGKIRGRQASGSWSAKGFGSSSGSWSASR